MHSFGGIVYGVLMCSAGGTPSPVLKILSICLFLFNVWASCSQLARSVRGLHPRHFDVGAPSVELRGYRYQGIDHLDCNFAPPSGICQLERGSAWDWRSRW